MIEFAAQAEAIINPPSVSWRELFLSRFIGRLPQSAAEVTTALVIEPETLAPGPDGELAVSGFFERATDPMFASLGGLLGTLDPATRLFTFLDQSPNDPFTFTGQLSANGRVMHVILSGENFVTESFPLIHEDTLAEIVPPDDQA